MYIAIDIGGTNIRVASSSSLESPVFIDIKRFENTKMYAKDIDHIIKAIESLRRDKQIEGIGIGSAGILNKKKTMLTFAEMMPDWNYKCIVDDLETAFHCKVVLDNDAYAAAIAEAKYGYGKGKNFLYIVWGTGIGGATIKNKAGQIEVDPFEPGHQSLNWNGALCPCGQRGCAELYCSGKNIAAKFHVKVEDLTKTHWDEINDAMAHVLLNTILIRPTRLIVLGGGVAIHQEMNVKKIEILLKKRITLFKAPVLKVTKMGDDIGLYGGLALLNQESSHP